jgi:uncharacterized protein (DUF1778 family)
MARAERSERLEARVSNEQKELFKRAARLRGRTVTEFVVSSAVEAARQVVREEEGIRLDSATSLAFVDALMRPPKPAARLQAAAKRYLSTSGG